MNLGRGTPSFRDIRLRVGDDQDHPISWGHPLKFDRTQGNWFWTEPVGFSWGVRSERQIATLPEAALCLEKANEQLRRDTHIDGVEALAKKLTPGLILNSYVSPELQIVAPFPFRLADTHIGAVRLIIPATAQPGWVSVRHSSILRLIRLQNGLSVLKMQTLSYHCWPIGNLNGQK
jgi:hypothetical protein